jgi:hypothetical protein
MAATVVDDAQQQQQQQQRPGPLQAYARRESASPAYVLPRLTSMAPSLVQGQGEAPINLAAVACHPVPRHSASQHHHRQQQQQQQQQQQHVPLLDDGGAASLVGSFATDRHRTVPTINLQQGWVAYDSSGGGLMQRVSPEPYHRDNYHVAHAPGQGVMTQEYHDVVGGAMHDQLQHELVSAFISGCYAVREQSLRIPC